MKQPWYYLGLVQCTIHRRVGQTDRQTARLLQWMINLSMVEFCHFEYGRTSLPTIKSKRKPKCIPWRCKWMLLVLSLLVMLLCWQHVRTHLVIIMSVFIIARLSTIAAYKSITEMNWSPHCRVSDFKLIKQWMDGRLDDWTSSTSLSSSTSSTSFG